MVEKNNTHHIRVSPGKVTFNEVDSELKAWYDEKLLKKHLPPTSGVLTADNALVSGLSKYLPEDIVDALKSTEFVNVFGRAIQRKDKRGPICLQYLYVWDYQAVPLHEGDYEPVFVYLDGTETYAIYDLIHYCTRRIEFPKPGEDGPGLRVVPGWHSFLPSTLKGSNVDRDLPLVPMSDQHLQSWWNIPDEESRFKIEGHILDPFRLKAPGHFMDDPDEEARTMCCTFKELEGAFNDFEDPKIALIEGLKRAFGKCIGIFALHRLSTFIKLVNEMDDVGMIKVSPAMKSGINLASIGTMLSDGFVSLTEKGKNFFDGFGKGEE